MGSGRQSDQQRMQQGYSSAQGLWSPGADVYQQGYDLSASNLTTGFLAGWSDMQKQYDEQQNMFKMFEGMFQGGGPQAPTGPTPEEIEAQRVADERAGWQSEYDSLLSERIGRATESASFINDQINTQQARADLYGLSYNMTDEMRSSKINDYFGSIWSGEQEAALGNVGGKLGLEFDTGGVMRGEGFEADQAADKVVSTEGTVAGGPVQDPEEDEFMGTATLLGGM